MVYRIEYVFWFCSVCASVRLLGVQLGGFQSAGLAEACFCLSGVEWDV